MLLFQKARWSLIDVLGNTPFCFASLVTIGATKHAKEKVVGSVSVICLGSAFVVLRLVEKVSSGLTKSAR